jgi:hypothetical protein
VVGHDLLAWFDPENPEILVVTDMQRRNPICVARSNEVSALECVTDPDSGRLAQELKRGAGQASYMKARFNAVKSKIEIPDDDLVKCIPYLGVSVGLALRGAAEAGI